MKMLITVRGNDKILTVLFLAWNGRKIPVLDKIGFLDFKLIEKGKKDLAAAGCTQQCLKLLDDNDKPYVTLEITGPKSEVFDKEIEEFRGFIRTVNNIEKIVTVAQSIPNRSLALACKMAGVKRPDPKQLKDELFSTIEVTEENV